MGYRWLLQETLLDLNSAKSLLPQSRVCVLSRGRTQIPGRWGGVGRGQEGTGEGAVSVGSRLQPVPAREEAASSRSQRRSTEVQLATEITPVVPSIKCLVPRCFAHITYK